MKLALTLSLLTLSAFGVVWAATGQASAAPAGRNATALECPKECVPCTPEQCDKLKGSECKPCDGSGPEGCGPCPSCPAHPTCSAAMTSAGRCGG